MKKDKKSILMIGSSIILFIFLFIIKGYIYYLLNINFSGISMRIKQVLDIGYACTMTLITLIFYLKLKEKKDLIKYLKTFFSGIGALCAYFILSELEVLPLLLSGVNIETIPLSVKVIYMLAYEIVMIFIIYLILKDRIDSAIVDIKKNHKEYFAKYFKYWLIALIIMSISNIVISYINGGQIAGNEESVRSIFSQAPIYMFISAVFFAPLLEEFVFRQGIRNIFSNDKLFIIMSGLVFGGLHVVGNINSWTDLLYLIPYCTPGFMFAYILSKTDNIFVSTGLHFLHNGIIMSLQILLLTLGHL